MSEALDKLIEAVERGEPNRNDGTLFRLFGDDWVHAWDVIDRGSLDAAMALHEALLPGWSVTLENDDGNIHAAVWPRGEIGEQHGSQGPTLARALLLAILRAYRQQRESGE